MFSSVTTYKIYKYKHHVKLMPCVCVCHHSCSLQVIDILQPKVLRGLDLQDRGNFQSYRVWWRHYPWIHGTKEFLKDKDTSSGNKLAPYVVGTHLIAHHRSKLQRTLIFGQLGLFPATGWTSKSSRDKGVNPFGSRRFLDHALACEKFKLQLYHSLHPNTSKYARSWIQPARVWSQQQILRLDIAVY